MNKIFAFLLLVLGIDYLDAQTGNSDSIKLLLQNDKSDTSRALHLANLSFEYLESNPDTTMKLLKYLNNTENYLSRFFWRTLAQQEVDYIEDTNGQITAYECKWNPNAKGSVSRAFSNAYPNAITHLIHPENAENFLL